MQQVCEELRTQCCWHPTIGQWRSFVCAVHCGQGSRRSCC